MFIIGRYIILNYYFYSAVILILFLISIEDFNTYKIKNKRLISLLFLFLIYPMIYAVDNVMFFWSRGDEFDDVQNLLRGNTIFADNMFLNITPNGVSFHDISHYSDYLHAFIFHTYNYIYSHFIPSVFSFFSILIMFLIAKLLTGKIIGMGDVKLYMVLALNAEYRIIYVIIISMFMWLTFYIIKNHIMKTCLVRNSKLKIHATKKSDTKIALGPFISLSYIIVLTVQLLY